MWKRNHRKELYYMITESDMETMELYHLRYSDMIVLSIINSSDGFGKCFMSNKKIGEMVRMQPDSVKKSLTRLVKSGLIRMYQDEGLRILEATKYDEYRYSFDKQPEEYIKMIDFVAEHETDDAEEESVLDIDALFRDAERTAVNQHNRKEGNRS